MLIRVSKFLSKWLPVITILVIGIGLVVGYYYPEVAKSLKPYVPIPLFLMLLPMMTGLNLGGVAGVLRRPKVLLSAILLNFVIVPPLGKLFAELFFRGAPPLLAVGYILNMVTPCSGMVAAWTGLAKGKVETALVIVSTSLILAIGFIPLWMWALTGNMVRVPVTLILKNLAYIVVAPLIAGQLIRKILIKKIGTKRFMEIRPYFPGISSFGMYIIIFISMALEAKTVISNPHYAWLVAASMSSFYLLVFALTVIYAKIAHIDYEDMVALAYGVTARNLSITIALALTTWGGLAVLAPAFDPPIQVGVMMLFLYLAPRLKPWLQRKRREVRSV